MNFKLVFTGLKEGRDSMMAWYTPYKNREDGVFQSFPIEMTISKKPKSINMNNELSPLISATELISAMKMKNVVILDARPGKDSPAGYTTYHIKGALHIDLNKQLANIGLDAAKGGRHPLPSPEAFSKVLTDLGITSDTHVIIYDSRLSSEAAARAWCMLRSAGHEKVQVLNGGLEAAGHAALELSSVEEFATKKPVTYKFDKWTLPLVDIDFVDKVKQDKNFLIIDVRDQDRYEGKREPIDLVAGHIPGAINIPYLGNLNLGDGTFLPPEELKEKYKEALGGRKAEQVIVHCGSGVTACHTLLAMASAGLDIPNLYVGSWSEWSRNDKAIATE